MSVQGSRTGRTVQVQTITPGPILCQSRNTSQVLPSDYISSCVDQVPLRLSVPHVRHTYRYSIQLRTTKTYEFVSLVLNLIP